VFRQDLNKNINNTLRLINLCTYKNEIAVLLTFFVLHVIVFSVFYKYEYLIMAL